MIEVHFYKQRPFEALKTTQMVQVPRSGDFVRFGDRPQKIVSVMWRFDLVSPSATVPVDVYLA